MGSLSGIPTVDLSSFFDGSGQAACQRVADELAQACHASGCVGIIGHGITDDLLQQGFATARKLFDLPMDQKMLAPHPNGAVPHRGYSAVGKEKAYTKEDLQQGEHYRDTLRKIVDCKETYEVGSESNEVQYNIWLPEAVLPGFRTFSTKLYWELHRTSMRILDAMIMALNLSDSEGDYVRSLHSGHGNQLRFSHYPPVPIDKLNKEILSRLPAHTDWSTFTLLFQDAAGGLEFEDPNNKGAFLPAVPDNGKLYLNVGDMLMRLSNNYFPSATHRVSVPHGLEQAHDQMTSARYSIPYFVLPDDEAVVFPQPSCVGASGGKAEYERTTLVDYAAHISKWQYEVS